MKLQGAYSGRLKLSTSAKERLEEFGKFLSAGQPRLVGQVSCRTFMILTDAAFKKETRTGGLGGVLLTGSGSALSYFSVPIFRTARGRSTTRVVYKTSAECTEQESVAKRYEVPKNK